MINALEIDFLPVGENSKSGDAIALRFGLYEDLKWKNQSNQCRATSKCLFQKKRIGSYYRGAISTTYYHGIYTR